ncbi:MAG: DUF2922 domain-containing protein [Dethiobacter sp.]|jgi:hypothetical protein|nr:DUF2922 domain-containing protein [Dethiobacter sp.]MBS3901294.1 DUF2922 domain-containing protein [Dethiobacter sp.]MBS3988329.1 DUF2922 domain-containing protein [Dethiobacter sp.]
METTLQLVFLNQEASSFTVNLANPRANLTVADVTAVMDLILAKNIFRSTGGMLTAKVRARLVSRDTVDLVTFA